MAEGILSDLTSKALETLIESAFQKAAAWWGARNDLKKLEQALRLIKARVNDAEKRCEEEGSALIKEWLVRLKQVLYRADDLFDDVLTFDNRKQQVRDGSTVVNKVRNVVSSSRLKWKIAQEAKSVREDFDVIKSEMAGLNLGVMVLRREPLLPMDTSSFDVRESDSFLKPPIVGRENDKNKIVEMLVDPNDVEHSVTVIPVVGLGGVGKTTLAQLVFHDERVEKHFPFRKWVCVPEVDRPREVMGRIYKSLTGKSYTDLSIDDIKSGIRDSVKDKKYLLVLDDIWDTNRDRWLEVVSLLEFGSSGSKVIVTTRLDEVASNVGTIAEPYRLGLLGDAESWDLFRRLSFKTEQQNDPVLTQIGKEIVKGCAKLPLAIRVVGTLLYSKETTEWENFRAELSKAMQSDGINILSVLKLSYDHLPAVLKRCFAYCSLFPKDHEFSRKDLVHLWLAQGYVEPPNEEAGDQYFRELLKRSFFQEVREDARNLDVLCTMHDLMHDLAQKVAGDEIVVVDESTVRFTVRIMHLNAERGGDLWKAQQHLLGATSLRTLLLGHHISRASSPPVVEFVSRFSSLRSLNLARMGIKTLPKSIKRLRHLRCLILFDNPIECLPDDITRLKNLQTLDLGQCVFLRELPVGFTTLVNLIHLSIADTGLKEMPQGLGNMECLRKLDVFILGQGNCADALANLNLRGSLTVERGISNAVVATQELNLKGSQHLSRLTINGANMKFLQLPLNLEFLRVHDYGGEKFLIRMGDGLSKLTQVTITECRKCQVLPLLSRQPHLKILNVESLDALEYIEEDVSDNDKEFFPSLESLRMLDLPKLKGWSRSAQENVSLQQGRLLFFPCLSKLEIKHCPKTMSMPLMPKLESLDALSIHEKLLKESILALHNQEEPSSSLSLPSLSTLKHLILTSIIGLVSLPIKFGFLNRLDLHSCKELGVLLLVHPNSLRSLDMRGCSNCRIASNKLQNLSTIEELEFAKCKKLDHVWDIKDDNDKEDKEEEKDKSSIEVWQALKSLRSLTLSSTNNLKALPRGITCLPNLEKLMINDLSKLIELPEDIGNLSQLRELEIGLCPKLRSLPQSIRNLTSLQELRIFRCPNLKKRCVEPHGEDWPLIQHVPRVVIY